MAEKKKIVSENNAIIKANAEKANEIIGDLKTAVTQKEAEISEQSEYIKILKNDITNKVVKLDNTAQAMFGLGVEDATADNTAEKVPEVYDKGVEAGKKSQYDEFWDAVQYNGTRVSYYGAFGYSYYPQGVFKPKYPIQPTSANRMFVATTIDLDDDEYLEIDFSKCTDIYWVFRNARIKRIGKCDFSSIAAGCAGAFSLSLDTVEIKEIVSHDNLKWSSDAFLQLEALQKVIFSGTIASDLNIQWSRKLTYDSLMSIINALSKTTTNKTITLSKTAVNNAFGIDIDNEATYPEGSEFYILRNTKANWTFSYV